MATPNVMVLKDHGTNCEEESKYAFGLVGGKAEIIHMEDLIRKPSDLLLYQILNFPGGFSHGDDTGAGLAEAHRVRNNFIDELLEFIERGGLILGVCNGFQVLATLGLVPALNGYENIEAALTPNEIPRYNCRWVDLEFKGDGPWLRGLDRMSFPIAHGEGGFYAPDETLEQINKNGLVAARYVEGEACKYQSLEPNPNGSLENIAGITDPSKRILGMMPHPERAIELTQLLTWPLLKAQYRGDGRELPEEGPGLQIFRNGVEYFK